MYNLSVISSFGLDVSFQTEKFCELYADTIPNTPKESIRVLWVMEPNEVSGFRQNTITNHENYDKSMNYHDFRKRIEDEVKSFISNN
tara:strand:+ start:6209 stop:6469 length:261 start_codon:yes stop_codon:yes gene_type:complete